MSDNETAEARYRRLFEERFNTIQDIKDSYGELEDYQREELFLLRRAKRLPFQTWGWPADILAYAKELVEAEDEIIRSY